MEKRRWERREADKRDRARLWREASKARCAVCGKEVTMEDRCNDGLYLHRDCALTVSTR